MSVEGVPDIAPAVQEAADALAACEQRLLELIRKGTREGASLDEILAGIEQLQVEARPQFRRIADLLGRRDLTFETVERLQAMRRHWLWLYRKLRLEHVFFSKLKLERGLRDALYRQVIETTHELSALDEQERVLQMMDEDRLARELLEDPASPRVEWVETT